MSFFFDRVAFTGEQRRVATEYWTRFKVFQDQVTRVLPACRERSAMEAKLYEALLWWEAAYSHRVRQETKG